MGLASEMMEKMFAFGGLGVIRSTENGWGSLGEG